MGYKESIYSALVYILYSFPKWLYQFLLRKAVYQCLNHSTFLSKSVLSVKKKKQHQGRCMCCAQSLSCVRLSVTPWIVACQATICSWGFSRQEYWSGLPYSPSGDLPDPGIRLESFTVSCIGRQVFCLFVLPPVPPGGPFHPSCCCCC